MNAVSRLSSKGQLVVPKAVRDQLGWHAADDIEFVLQPDSVTLRAVPRQAAGLSFEEALAKLRAISRYVGPRISDEQISEAGQLAAAEQYSRTCDR